MSLLDKLLAAADRAETDQERNPGDDLPHLGDPSEQTEDEKKLCSFVKSKVEEIRMSGNRVAHEAVWMTNIAYVLGFDNIFYDTNTRTFARIGKYRSAAGRGRVHINKILPTLQRRLARLCKNAPRYEVRPDEGDQKSKDRARLEQQILEMYWDRERIQEKRIGLMMGAQECGHYYFRVLWDTQKGELLQAEEDGREVYEFEGDLALEVCSAFEIFPDPLAKNFDELLHLTHCKVRKLDYFRTHYPNRGHLVKEEDCWLLSLQYEQRINSMTGNAQAGSGTALQTKNAAIEMVYYEKPSQYHPRGRMITVANGVLLADEELPVGEIPFAKYDDVVVAGKYYPEAITTHLRPIQDQYNRTVAIRAAWTNRCAFGKIIAAKGHGIIAEGMNDQSGEIVEYNPVAGASEPKGMDIPVIPQYLYQETEELGNNFYDVAGEGDVSRGLLPAAGVPAIGMQLLLEQDETRIAIMTEQHEHAFARLGRIMLKYLEKKVTNQRLLKFTGPDSEYQIKNWTGSDLKSKHDVLVKRGSLAPTSKAMKRNDIMSAFESGLLGMNTDPNVLLKVLKSLEYGDLSEFWQDIALDMGQIKKHMTMIEQGIVPEVHEADNHILAFQEMNKYRKSDKFDDLGPERQAIFLQIMEEHIQETMKLTAPQFGMSPDAADDVGMVDMQVANEAEAMGEMGSDPMVAEQAGEGALGLEDEQLTGEVFQ